MEEVKQEGFPAPAPLQPEPTLQAPTEVLALIYQTVQKQQGLEQENASLKEQVQALITQLQQVTNKLQQAEVQAHVAAQMAGAGYQMAQMAGQTAVNTQQNLEHAGAAIQATASAVQETAHRVQTIEVQANASNNIPPQFMNVQGAVLNVSALQSQTPLPVVTFPSVTTGAPIFDGSDPEKEGLSAADFQNHFEMMKATSPYAYGPGQLMLQATSRFVKGGSAWHWWQCIVTKARKSGTVPFHGDWSAFTKAFLEAMKGPQEAVLVRVALRELKVENNDVMAYCNKFRQLTSRLEALDESMGRLDQILQFSLGLPSKLTDAISFAAPDLEAVMRKVQDKFLKSKLNRSAYASKDVYAHVVEEPDEEQYSEDLYALGYRPRGRGGRAGNAGRGGTGPPGAGRGARSGDFSQRGRGAPRGRGAARSPGKRLTPQQQSWFNSGKCLLCGDSSHWAADCPSGGVHHVADADESNE